MKFGFAIGDLVGMSTMGRVPPRAQDRGARGVVVDVRPKDNMVKVAWLGYTTYWCIAADDVIQKLSGIEKQ